MHDLRATRKAKGLSLQEVADHFKVSKNTILKWELGLLKPRVKRAKKFCEFYNVTLEQLYEDVLIS